MWLQTKITIKNIEIRVQTTSKDQLLTRLKVSKVMKVTNPNMLKTGQEILPTMLESTEGNMQEISQMMLIDISWHKKLKISQLITGADTIQDQWDQVHLQELWYLHLSLRQEFWLLLSKRLSSTLLHSVIMNNIGSRGSKESIRSILKFKMSIRNNLKWLKLAKELEKELLQLTEQRLNLKN